ncbi:hypothetical protein J5N97_010831 [Dioscorea zingiberensis]|uniref:Uncharacterized protein n=1 Tax=Dioscorea zingiberensis TaxID=325984 RepID=A0A9D5HN55_9LILI|nr:hypothetical protein J5N97_010831 [Dioscorea zingiberensis]
MKAAVPQQVIQTQPLQESQLSQPTCNFLMVAPTLPGVPVSSSLLSAVAPLALKTNGSFDGNKPVMVNLSSGSISKEDSKREKATSHPSPGCNAIQIGQTGTTQVISGNAAGAGSSETQLMAVPMTFFVPMISNSSTSCSVAVTNTSVALISPMPIPVDATRSCLSGSPSQALNLSRLTPPLVAIQKGTQPTVPEAHTNSVRATAIAAGARIASPTAAASIIKAIQAKTPIHIKARESSPARSTSPSDLGSSVPKPSALTTDTTMVQNAPVQSDMPMDAYNELMNEGLNADKAASASDSPGMDFTDASNDDEMTC